jgi:alkylation response protein AidB-like acyl-CoA dehydrogenase
MTSLADTDNRVVALARGMRDLVQAEAAESERMRTLTPTIVDEMWASGLMSSFNPVAAGGVEPSFNEMIETWIEMAWQDGSFGWIGIANLPSSFAAAAYLPDEGFAEVFTAHDNRVTMGGQFFPNGQGTAVDGGYLLNGSWSFGSGTGHSEYVAAGFFPMDNGEMRWAGEGLPDMQVAVLPRAEINFKDGWHVQGLKGTGSYDYSVENVFVPTIRTFGLFDREPYRGASPATRMGMMPITAAGHASWALGVAKSMLDDVQELAATKYRMSDMESLASRPTFQRGSRITAQAGAPLVFWCSTLSPRPRLPWRQGRTSPRPCAPTCGWPPSTRQTRPAAVPSGPIWSPAPARSAKAADSNAPSATCTREHSTRSSAKRSLSTRPRSGWASSKTSRGFEPSRARRLYDLLARLLVVSFLVAGLVAGALVIPGQRRRRGRSGSSAG